MANTHLFAARITYRDDHGDDVRTIRIPYLFASLQDMMNSAVVKANMDRLRNHGAIDVDLDVDTLTPYDADDHSDNHFYAD